MRRETFSVNRVAVNLRVDRRTLTKRLEGVAPAPGGDYYLADVFRALHGTPAAGELELARTRLAREQGKRLEMENKVRAGELAPITEIAEVTADYVGAVVTRLHGIPTTTAQHFGQPLAGKIRADVADQIDAALVDLQKYTKRLLSDAGATNGENMRRKLTGLRDPSHGGR